MSKQKFDERQLWIRGNIFKHAFIAQFILLLLNAFVTDHGIIWADRFYMNVILMFIPVTICTVELIFRDVYVQTTLQRGFFIVIFGLTGLSILINKFDHLLNGNPFLLDNQLTKNGGSLVMAFFFLVIDVSLIIKTIMNKVAKLTE